MCRPNRSNRAVRVPTSVSSPVSCVALPTIRTPGEQARLRLLYPPLRIGTAGWGPSEVSVGSDCFEGIPIYRKDDMNIRRIANRAVASTTGGRASLRQRIVGVARRRSPGAADDFCTTITRLQQRSLVAVHGVVDAGTSAEFREAITDSLNFSSLPVTIDLTDAEFVDAGAVRFLADEWHRAAIRGINVEMMLNVTLDRPLGQR